MEEKNYIKLFDTVTDYQNSRGFNYYEPWLSYTEENGKVNYNKTYEEAKNEYINRELTFEVISGENLVWKGGTNNKTVQYHKNGGDWTNTTTSTTISVEAGDIVQFRGSNNSYTESHFSASTCTYKLSGNIMSLIYATGFSGGTYLDGNQCFSDLFNGCTGLIDAQYLILFPTYDERETINNGCYAYMFQNCTNLVIAPTELPLIELTKDCYNGMFQDCTSLTSAPEIKATTFRDSASTNVCEMMFKGCTSLVNGPSVLAAEGVYQTGYNTPEGPYRFMFSGCTSLVASPDLPVEKLDCFAYQGMFQGCTSLISISCYATEIGGSGQQYATYQWVQGVPTGSNGTFSKSPDMEAWTRGTNGIPTGWDVIG